VYLPKYQVAGCRKLPSQRQLTWPYCAWDNRFPHPHLGNESYLSEPTFRQQIAFQIGILQNFALISEPIGSVAPTISGDRLQEQTRKLGHSLSQCVPFWRIHLKIKIAANAPSANTQRDCDGDEYRGLTFSREISLALLAIRGDLRN